MQRPFLYRRPIISLILILQIIPLLLFTSDVFARGSQEWWLPAMLTAMALIAVINIFVRGGSQLWPWLLVSFVQGFNIISRLMLVWPQASATVAGETVMKGGYIAATIVAILLSGFMLWYTEKPAVREGLLRA